MLDDLERMRSRPPLLELFCHYAKLGEPNREAWQPRRMEMEQVSASELSKLHGELIAFDMIEQNTFQVPCCYRVTPAGQRRFLLIENQREEDGTTTANEETEARAA